MDTNSRSVEVLGPALKLVRSRTGIRTTDLAEQVGVLPQTISNIESGRKNPSPALWARICASLNIDQTALIVCEQCSKPPAERHSGVAA